MKLIKGKPEHYQAADKLAGVIGKAIDQARIDRIEFADNPSIVCSSCLDIAAEIISHAPADIRAGLVQWAQHLIEDMVESYASKPQTKQ